MYIQLTSLELLRCTVYKQGSLLLAGKVVSQTHLEFRMNRLTFSQTEAFSASVVFHRTVFLSTPALSTSVVFYKKNKWWTSGFWVIQPYGAPSHDEPQPAARMKNEQMREPFW